MHRCSSRSLLVHLRRRGAWTTGPSSCDVGLQKAMIRLCDCSRTQLRLTRFHLWSVVLCVNMCSHLRYFHFDFISSTCQVFDSANLIFTNPFHEMRWWYGFHVPKSCLAPRLSCWSALMFVWNATQWHGSLLLTLLQCGPRRRTWHVSQMFEKWNWLKKEMIYHTWHQVNWIRVVFIELHSHITSVF